MKPRNPFVKHAMFRKAGAHIKTLKAIRRQEKVIVQKHMKEVNIGDQYLNIFK